MALDISSLSDLKAEIEKGVDEAANIADQVDHYADIAEHLAGDLPGVGPEVKAVVPLLDEATRALDALRAALADA